MQMAGNISGTFKLAKNMEEGLSRGQTEDCTWANSSKTLFKERALISGPIRTGIREILSKACPKARGHTSTLTGLNSTVYFGMDYPGKDKRLILMEDSFAATFLGNL